MQRGAAQNQQDLSSTTNGEKSEGLLDLTPSKVVMAESGQPIDRRLALLMKPMFRLVPDGGTHLSMF